ncbi:MAG: hypothetical protein V1799_16355 [bacterium]
MKQYHLLFIALLFLLPACSSEPEHPDLEQAAKAVEYLVAPFSAPKVSFFAVLPNGTPKQFVSWFFSSMGSADWPPIEGTSEFSPDELASMRQIGIPLRPKDVFYRHTQPDPNIQKQIVLKWNDTEGTVILEGYIDPKQSAVLTRSFKLPKGVIPNEMARLVVQSNLESGMRYQSF